MTAGIVSARGRDIGAGPYDDFIQIDAPVNKGNSGGPTFDVDGNVIGVNTAIFSPSGGVGRHRVRHPGRDREDGRRPAQGQRRRHPRLDRRADPAGHRRDRRQPRPEECARARWLLSRRPDSPAVKAGIKCRRRHHLGQRRGGEGRPRARSQDQHAVARRPRSTSRVMRDGKEETVTLTLGELPKERQATRRHPGPRGSRCRRAEARPVARARRPGRRPNARVWS